MKSGTFGSFIRILRTQKKITRQEICDKTSLSTTMIQRIEEGKANPHPDILRELAKILETDYHELLEACGYLDNTTASSNGKSRKEGQSVPLIAWSALPGIRPLDKKAVDILAQEKVSSTLDLQNLFALRVYENQWAEAYIKGDILIIQKNRTHYHGDTVVVLNPKKEGSPKPNSPATLKKLRLMDKKWFLFSISKLEFPDCEPLTKENKALILGTVVESRRFGENIDK